MTATQLQFRRGTAAQMATFTGAAGEVVVDTSTNRTVVHDGATAGGFAAAKLNELATFRNFFINPACDIDQRGTRAAPLTVATSGGNVLDGNTIVLPTGAAVNAAQAAAPSGTISQNCLSVSGTTSNTDVIVRKRIESIDAAKLAGQTVVVQAKINQNTGAAVVPKLSVGHPAGADSYGGVGTASLTNELNAQNLQSCGSGVTTTVAYALAVSANAVNGLEVNFDLGALVSGQTAKITDFDIRIVAGLSAGQLGNPPVPELRLAAIEQILCERFYQVTVASIRQVAVVASQPIDDNVFYRTMHAAPSVTVASGGTRSNVGAGPTPNSIGVNSLRYEIFSSSGGNVDTYTIADTLTLRAELV